MMDQENSTSYGNGKRPLWQWLLIYAIIGFIIYGLIYYFVLAKKGGENLNPSPSTPPTTSLESTSSGVEISQNTITLTADRFEPVTLNVKTGTKVTWINQSGSDATVDSDPHPAHSAYPPLNLGSFANGGTLSLTFDKPGTYGYHNHLNPSQTATILVSP